MSIIAESLKKIKKNSNKEKKYFVNINDISFSYTLLLNVIFLIFFTFIVFFAGKTFLTKKIKIRKYPSIAELKKAYQITYIKNREKEKYSEKELSYLIATNQINKLKLKLSKLKKIDKRKFLLYRGIISYKEDRLEEAERDFKNFIKKFGENDIVLNYFGLIYYKKGDMYKALDYFNRISKKDDTVIYNLAIIYEKLYNLQNALRYYKKFIQITDNQLLKKRIRTKLFLIENYEKKYN